MTSSKIVRTEKTVRGPFGQVVKWGFILFNLGMIAWTVSYCGFVGDTMNKSASSAESAGTAIGGTIGVGMLLFLWVVGDIILGILVLLTKGKRIIVEETQP